MDPGGTPFQYVKTVQISGVGREEGDALCGIDDAPSSQGDNPIAVLLPVNLKRIEDVFLSWIRGHSIKLRQAFGFLPKFIHGHLENPAFANSMIAKEQGPGYSLGFKDAF